MNLIDHLPRASHYIQALSLDEEYASAIAKIQREDAGSSGPPMSTYTAEAEALAALIDLVKQGNALFLSANSKPGAQMPKLEPYPRPKTAFETARQRVRAERHKALSARLLRRSTTSD